MFTSGPCHVESIGSFMGEPLYHGSLGEAEYRLLLDWSGSDVVSHVVRRPDRAGIAPFGSLVRGDPNRSVPIGDVKHVSHARAFNHPCEGHYANRPGSSEDDGTSQTHDSPSMN